MTATGGPASRFGRFDRGETGPRASSRSSAPRRSPARRAFDRTCRDPRTGKVVIAQPPNLPLGVFLVATTLRLVADPSGSAATTLAVVAAVAIVWWAGDEIVRGDSLFRRILGGVVLLAMVAGQLMR